MKVYPLNKRKCSLCHKVKSNCKCPHNMKKTKELVEEYLNNTQTPPK